MIGEIKRLKIHDITNEDIFDAILKIIKDMSVCLDLGKHNFAQAKQFLDQLTIFLEQKKVHSKFPFPIYILTQKIKKHPPFQIIKSFKNIPSHFNRRTKYNKIHEKLNNKNKVLAQKFKNISLYKTRTIITRFANGQQELYKLCSESNYYQELLKCLE